MSNDDLGDRMKLYERVSAGRRFMPLLPTVARIDGRSFSNFTRGMRRPYEPTLSKIMVETARYLCEVTNARVAYTQSDEISLLWYSTDIKSQTYFDGREQKMVSQLSAEATLKFYELVLQYMPEYARKRPKFDSRVWQVPNKVEATNVFVWREKDAVKNSVSMAASHYYSEKFLMGKSDAQRQELLFQKGVNWNDYPAFFKRGTYVQRRVTSKPFSVEEIARLPPKHKAHTNPDLVIERADWRVVEFPILTTIVNRTDVLFDGAEPIVATG